MQDYLDDEKLKQSNAKIDKTILNTALELFACHGFSKIRLCNITVGEVYDDVNIKPEIVIDSKKTAFKTQEDLESILASYIDHLKANYSIETDAFLFPGYHGDKGLKKLQRHVKKYTSHYDLNALKKDARKNLSNQLAATGQPLDDRIKKIAVATGKSTRTAKKIIGIPVERRESTSKISHSKIIADLFEGNIPQKPDLLKFIEIEDQIVVLPETIALSEEAVKKLIVESFNLIPPAKTKTDKSLQAIVQMKCGLLGQLQDRVNEIEGDVLEERKEIKDARGSQVEQVERANFAQLINNAKKRYEAEKAEELEKNEKKQKATVQVTENNEIIITDALIKEKFDQLIARIKQVRNLIPESKWQEWTAK